MSTNPDNAIAASVAAALTDSALAERLAMLADDIGTFSYRSERDAFLREAAARLRGDEPTTHAPTAVPSGEDDPLMLTMPDGRVVGLWAHHCPSCTSLDVWTVRPGAANPSYHYDGRNAGPTGAPDRQPVGVFGMGAGTCHEMAGGCDGSPQTLDRPAQSTVVLVWNDPGVMPRKDGTPTAAELRDIARREGNRRYIVDGNDLSHFSARTLTEVREEWPGDALLAALVDAELDRRTTTQGPN